MAHIASIPVALKMEVRDQRNISELRGLLSVDDIGKMHCAESITSHCVDVIQSYFYSASSHVCNRMSNWSNRMAFIKIEIMNLERAIRSCLFLKSFEIAPGFMVLLRTLMVVWFLLLPFILAESAGKCGKLLQEMKAGWWMKQNDMKPARTNYRLHVTLLWRCQTGWFSILWVPVIAYGLVGWVDLICSERVALLASGVQKTGFRVMRLGAAGEFAI